MKKFWKYSQFSFFFPPPFPWFYSLLTLLFQMLEKDIVYITRPVDKKKILFYNDKTAHMPIDEEFQKLWRSVAVDGIDDNKIEEYLENQGIRSMQDTSQKVLPAKLKRKAAPKKRTYKKPRDNEHLKEILEDYEWNSKLFSTDAPNFLYHLYGKPNVPDENGDESCCCLGNPESNFFS